MGICTECQRAFTPAPHNAKKQETCGRAVCHKNRTARLALEKYQARRRGRYLTGADYALPRPDNRTKCHTRGCMTLTADYWCSKCRRSRNIPDAMGGHSPIDECPFI